MRTTILTGPREPIFFQDVLYPDTAGLELAVEAEDWMSRLDAYPTLISLREASVPSKQWDRKAHGHNVLSHSWSAISGHPGSSNATAITDVPSGTFCGTPEAGRLEEGLQELGELRVLLVEGTS